MADKQVIEFAKINKQIADTQAQIAKLKLQKVTSNNPNVIQNQIITMEQKVNRLTASLKAKAPIAAQTGELEVEESIYDFVDYFEESSGFIKYIVKKSGVSKAKAERFWNKATKSFEKTPKYKDITGPEKYKIIAGIAKKIAKLNEDGEGGVAASGMGSAQTGINMAGNSPGITVAGVYGPNYERAQKDKIGDKPYNPGKYKGDEKTLLRRNKPVSKIFAKAKPTKSPKKKRNESIEVNNYVDNLFE